MIEGGVVWMNKARSQTEIERTASVARALRCLNQHIETRRAERREPRWRVEGHHLPNEEAVYVSWDGFASEARLMHRDDRGCWQLNDKMFYNLDLPENGGGVVGVTTRRRLFCGELANDRWYAHSERKHDTEQTMMERVCFNWKRMTHRVGMREVDSVRMSDSCMM